MEVERSLQHIHLTHQQLLEMVQQAFPLCQKLDNYEILSGGALNTTYKLEINQKRFVLRIYARERSHCKTEKAIHQLIDKSVSTPKLIYADDQHNPWAYSIFEFMPGNHLTEAPIKDKTPLCYDLGHLLASIHAFKFPEAGFFGEDLSIIHHFKSGSSPYFEETYSVLSQGTYVRHRLGDKLTDEALSFIQKNKDFFPIVENNICLTHSDFKPVNLLYNSGKVFVIDWEFAHAGIGILDFSILLRHREQFPFDVASLAKGYTDFGGSLPEEWFRSALITDFVNIVTLLESPPERPKLFHQLKNSIQNTISNWE